MLDADSSSHSRITATSRNRRRRFWQGRRIWQSKG